MPTPIIPTSPSVEALNIRETRRLMEPREFLTTAKLPMSVDMKAPNVSSHSRVKVNKNLPAKVLEQASVSANLPTQNLTKPGNHLVPTEMPKPTNLSAPNLFLDINIPTSKRPLLPEELLASTNVQERYAPEREDSQVLETLAKPTSNHPMPTDNTSTVNLLLCEKVQETRSVQPLNISESGITPAIAHAIMTMNLYKSSSLPEPTNRLPHNFPAPTDLMVSEKLPAFMNTPVLSIPEPINISATPANLPKSENMRAANIKPRSNHQIYISLRKPKLHEPANTPTPIIPTSPSVEALNIKETRTLMEPREFLTTAKLPMSVDMKAPNVSSHSRVKVNKNLPAKVMEQASVSANLPTQNLTKPGNHLVPTKMPNPTNLSAPNLPLGINIPTSNIPLVPEELLASTNVQKNLRAANIKPRSNRQIYISLRKPSALSNLPAHKNFPAPAEVLAEVNLVAPLTGIPSLSSAGQANRSVSVNPPTSSQQPQMNTLASMSLVELASMPRHENFLAPNFPNTMSQPLNLYVPESLAKPTDQPATRLQVTTNLPEPSSIAIGQLASLASDLDAPVREQQSPNLDTFYDPYTYEGSHSSRLSRKYVKVGVVVYFVIVPVVSSIAISHLWAVGNADVPFFLPYISDSGGDPPQSAVFGLGLTTAAIAAIVTFSLRYVTVMDISKAKNLPGYILLLNYINFLAGIGIFLGLILVAMNPTGHLRRDGTWLNPIFVPHVVGASVLFVSGLGYMLANALLTLCLVDQYRNYAVFKARVVIFAFDLVACALTAAKFPKDLLSMKPHPNSPREYPDGTIISIIAEWLMLATFMGYFYTMKSELDAMVVVIGIQKRRSLLGGDESPHDTAPPQFPPSASTGKVRDAQNLTQKPNGAADQGLLKFTSSVASADHQDCSVMLSCNERPLSSLPSVIHSKPAPEEASMVPAQSIVERSRSTGHSGLSGAFQCDLARAVDAIPPPGQRRIKGSRQSSLYSGLTTASTKVSASRLPKSTVQNQQDVIAGVSSPDSTSIFIKRGKSHSEELSTPKKEMSGKWSSEQERTTTPSSGRSKSHSRVSSLSSSRVASGPVSTRGQHVAENQ